MRKIYPKDGDRRTVSRFLLFPRTIDHERRWLEKVTIKQRANLWGHAGNTPLIEWEDQCFVDEVPA